MAYHTVVEKHCFEMKILKKKNYLVNNIFLHECMDGLLIGNSLYLSSLSSFNIYESDITSKVIDLYIIN